MRLIPTGSDASPVLLNQIMQGDPTARITADELVRVTDGSVGLFALSYRHQGPKGYNIPPQLWSDVIFVANAIASCATFKHYALWIDTVSAAAKKSSGEVADYIDWFTIGVAPYILLPTILVADEAERVTRMWLRLEEKLSHYGACGVFAMRVRERVVKLEPGHRETRTQDERLWCLCHSVLRGEYNGLETTYKEDFVSLLRWAIEFEKNATDFRGLHLIFGCSEGFRGELPIETGCYILQKPITGLEWCGGAEAAGGFMEYVRLSGDLLLLHRRKSELQMLHKDQSMLVLQLKHRRALGIVQFRNQSTSECLTDQRWRS